MTSLGPWSPPIASTAIVTPRPSSASASVRDGFFGRSSATDTSGGGVGRGLLELDRLAALVPAAVRADVMRQLRLVAVVALHELRHAQRQVRAPLALPGVRDASLRNTHGPWSPSMSVGRGGRGGRGAPGCPPLGRVERGVYRMTRGGSRERTVQSAAGRNAFSASPRGSTAPDPARGDRSGR